MTNFADNLKTLPSISHLSHLELYDAAGHCVARIENKPGQAGSLAVYAMLAGKYGQIDADAAAEGLQLYAEHTQDARNNPGKHPNIDRLLALQENRLQLTVKLSRQTA